MNALSVSDLTPMAGEPRVLDLEIGERLGFERPRDIRKIIKRNEVELCRYGVCATVAQTVGENGGRPTLQYLLNEAQALLICMKSATDKAVEVREQIINVFLAWRRGELTPMLSREATAAIDSSVATMQRMEARLDAMEGLGARLDRLADRHRESAKALTHLVAIYFDAIHQARPRFWHDIEVRGLVLACHRQMTVDQALALITKTCGEKRAPSRSALHRFWQRLDRMRHATPTLQVH